MTGKANRKVPKFKVTLFHVFSCTLLERLKKDHCVCVVGIQATKLGQTTVTSLSNNALHPHFIVSHLALSCIVAAGNHHHFLSQM